MRPEQPRPFPWEEALALGLGRLRLLPEQFWALTPRELVLMASGGRMRGEALDRAGLDALMRRVGEAG
jgi:uncharacterized phage protein (TIGR02216 family)